MDKVRQYLNPQDTNRKKMTMPIIQKKDWYAVSDLVAQSAIAAEETLQQLAEVEEPGSIVRALEPYDLLLVWNQADEEQKADLLKYANKDQVFILSDLTCWQGDTPNLDATLDLIGPLAMSGYEGADRALDLLEDELKTLLFKRNIRVHLLENRNDDLIVPDTSELISCPDGFYHLEIEDPDQFSDIERALLQAMLLRPFEHYQRELECIKHDFASELTESSYKWRKGRLADYGFATREDSVSLLTPLSINEVLHMAETSAPITRFPTDLSMSALYRNNLGGNEFLDTVLDIIRNSDDPDMINRIGTLDAELSAMTNLFLSAAGTDIGNIKEVVRSIAWARDMMSLGLMETSNLNEDTAARLLTVLPPGTFIRAALGLIYPLQKRARKLLGDKKLVPAGRRGAIFDPPYYIVLSSLDREIPCHWPMLEHTDQPPHSLFEPGIEDLAPFSTPNDIVKVELLLEEAEQLPSLLFDGLGCEQPPVRGTPASILVMNALANASAGRDPSPKAIAKEEANVFAAELLQLTEEQLLGDSLAVLTPLVFSDIDTAEEPSDDPDPMKRLLIRLIQIGRSRLAADAPERALLIENF